MMKIGRLTNRAHAIGPIGEERIDDEHYLALCVLGLLTASEERRRAQDPELPDLTPWGERSKAREVGR